MIEKFNFYDIYGYLIPGLVLIGILCVPFGILFQAWPKADIASAVLILLLAYVLGHVIQSFALSLMPSKVPDREGNLRHPSDLVLDHSDSSFTNVTKQRIAGLTRRYFQLDVSPAENIGSALRQALEERMQFDKTFSEKQAAIAGDLEALEREAPFLDKLQRELRKKRIQEQQELVEASEKRIENSEHRIRAVIQNRDEAFFLARSALLRNEGHSYWEQFEGLYAMMRGISGACSASSSYLAGWFFALLCQTGGRQQMHFWNGVVIALLLLFLAIVLRFSISSLPVTRIYQQTRRDKEPLSEQREREEIGLWASRISLLFVPLLAGVFFGLNAAEFMGAQAKGSLAGVHAPLLVLLAAFAALIVAVRCFGAYKAFAREFALAVWRDFSNIEADWTKAEKNWSPVAQEFYASGQQDC